MKFKLLSLVMILGLMGGSAVAQNLINNGGFEDGFTGWTLTGHQDGNTAAVGCGWSTVCPHSGNLQAVFGAVGAPGGISQDVTTTPGGRYEVSFWLQNDGGSPTTIEVSFGGVTLISATNQGAFGYTFFDYLVDVNAPVSTLSFSIQDDPAYYSLDDVTVAEAPEPASLTLLGSAMGLGMGFIRKYRK